MTSRLQCPLPFTSQCLFDENTPFIQSKSTEQWLSFNLFLFKNDRQFKMCASLVVIYDKDNDIIM